MDRKTLSQKSLADLRELAKMQGVKSLTKYRKDDLIDIIMAGGDISVLNPTEPVEPPRDFMIEDITDEQKPDMAEEPTPLQRPTYHVPAEPVRRIQTYQRQDNDRRQNDG